MPRKAFVSSRLAPATGPFSDVVHGGELVFLAGQLGQDPASATLGQGGAPEQVRQIFRNIRLWRRSGWTSALRSHGRGVPAPRWSRLAAGYSDALVLDVQIAFHSPDPAEAADEQRKEHRCAK
ncbi:RidA family protein [Deinococcus aluminii]|uniref:RidA family protein n=1 Tax=Deinococcus aluminii TaxID=1656885 RepID=UPI003CD09641